MSSDGVQVNERSLAEMPQLSLNLGNLRMARRRPLVRSFRAGRSEKVFQSAQGLRQGVHCGSKIVQRSGVRNG